MSQAHAYRFGPWRLVPAEHQLLRGETPVTLTPKAFETLCVLVERHGHLVTTQALLEAVGVGLRHQNSELLQRHFTRASHPGCGRHRIVQ